MEIFHFATRIPNPLVAAAHVYIGEQERHNSAICTSASLLPVLNFTTWLESRIQQKGRPGQQSPLKVCPSLLKQFALLGTLFQLLLMVIEATMFPRILEG